MPEGIGIVIGAVLAALASMIVVIVTKEQKISEFRQQWIDALRSETADLLSEISTIRAIASFKKDANDEERFEAMKEYLLRATAIDLRISLRLNMEEELHKQLAQKFADLLPPLQNPELPWPSYEAEIVPLLQRILKKEWNRVKKGERMHRVAQYLSLCIVVGGFGYGTWYAVEHWNSPPQVLESKKPAEAGS